MSASPPVQKTRVPAPTREEISPTASPATSGPLPDTAECGTLGEQALSISVVLPTYRRPQTLARCLQALISQNMLGHQYEILVCDDGPDPQTRDLVECYASEAAERASETVRPPIIRYLPVTGTQGPAGARNLGWRAAHSPLIAFTDDDTEATVHWLYAGLIALTQQNEQSGTTVVAVSGKIIVPLPTLPTDYERDASGLSSAEFATANVFVRRSFLDSCGGFDERFTAAWREDSDLHFMLLKAGAHIARSDDAVIVHPVRPARWGVSMSQQKKSQFDALLFKKHPQLFRQRIYPVFPTRYYATLLCVVLFIIGTLTRNGLASTCGLGLWLLFTVTFALQRLRGTRHDWRHVSEMICTSAVLPFMSITWRVVGALRFRVLFL